MNPYGDSFNLRRPVRSPAYRMGREEKYKQMETQTKKFANVTIYRNGVFGPCRTDCKMLEVTGGERSAHVVYLEKGKRKFMQFRMTDNRDTLVIVPTAEAVPLRDPMTAPEATGTGFTIRTTRFSMFDKAYTDELIEDLAKASPTIHFAFGYGTEKLAVTA